MNDNLKELNELPVRKAVLSNAIPAMMAMLMVLVYNMADLFFIGQTGDDLQVAAVSMATPIFLMFMSLGNVFGNGGASFLSRSLGSGKGDMVKRISAFCFWNCIVCGLALSAIVILSIDGIVGALGASGDTAGMVSDYIIIISASGVFILISSCYSALVRAEGKPQKAMQGMMIGNLVNIILDPIFILMLDKGVMGAAIATFIGNALGAAYYLIYLFKADTQLSTKLKNYSYKDGIAKNVLAIGIPASLSSILFGISQMVLNGQMAKYGDFAVAGIGVAMKITMITTMICIGIGMGVQPLLGYAIGSQNEKRYHETFRFSIIFAFSLSAVLTLLCYAFLEQIVALFVTETQSVEYARFFSRVIISTSVICSMLYVFANALQAAGAAVAALIVNISRQGLLFIPLLLIMGKTIGINGLVLAQPIADVTTLIIAITFYKKATKTFFIKT